MLTVCYAVKGGSGTSVVAAALALALSGDEALLVDLSGDAPAVLGVDAAGASGVSDWLAADVDPDALLDLAQPVRHGLAVVPVGTTTPDPASARWPLLAGWLAARDAPVVVDAGTGEPPPALCDAAGRLLLVIRPCYLALTHARRSARRPDGLVVVSEPQRALGWRDVAACLDVPVVAHVRTDDAVARAIDAGLMATAVPRQLLRPMRRLAGSVRGVA